MIRPSGVFGQFGARRARLGVSTPTPLLRPAGRSVSSSQIPHAPVGGIYFFFSHDNKGTVGSILMGQVFRVNTHERKYTRGDLREKNFQFLETLQTFGYQDISSARVFFHLEFKDLCSSRLKPPPFVCSVCWRWRDVVLSRGSYLTHPPPPPPLQLFPGPALLNILQQRPSGNTPGHSHWMGISCSGQAIFKSGSGLFSDKHAAHYHLLIIFEWILSAFWHHWCGVQGP